MTSLLYCNGGANLRNVLGAWANWQLQQWAKSPSDCQVYLNVQLEKNNLASCCSGSLRPPALFSASSKVSPYFHSLFYSRPLFHHALRSWSCYSWTEPRSSAHPLDSSWTHNRCDIHTPSRPVVLPGSCTSILFAYRFSDCLQFLEPNSLAQLSTSLPQSINLCGSLTLLIDYFLILL